MNKQTGSRWLLLSRPPLLPPASWMCVLVYYGLFLPLRTGCPCKPSSSRLHFQYMSSCPRIKVDSLSNALGFWNRKLSPPLWLLCMQTSPLLWWLPGLNLHNFSQCVNRVRIYFDNNFIHAFQTTRSCVVLRLDFNCAFWKCRVASRCKVLYNIGWDVYML